MVRLASRLRASSDDVSLFRCGVARFSANGLDRVVHSKIDRPIVLIPTEGTHCQHGPHRRELEQLDRGRGLLHHVFDFR